MTFFYYRRCTGRTSTIFLESEVLLKAGAKLIINHMINYVYLNLDKTHKNPFRYILREYVSYSLVMAY